MLESYITWTMENRLGDMKANRIKLLLRIHFATYHKRYDKEFLHDFHITLHLL